MALNRLITWISCVVVMLGVSNADAFPNEPDGFGDITWGAVIRKVEQFQGLGCHSEPDGGPSTSGGTPTFQCLKTKVDDFDVRGVWYHLTPDYKLRNVLILLYPSNAEPFFAALKAKYGEPTSKPSDKEVYVWEGEKTVISYAYVTDAIVQFTEKPAPAQGTASQ